MSRVLLRHLLPVLGALAALVATPAAAADELPELPNTPSGKCVDVSKATLADKPWAQRTLLPERVWPLADGAGVLVAVLDSGVRGEGQLAGVVTGSGNDCAGHGTFVASLIAARPAAGTGFAGLAPGATVLSVPANWTNAAAAITTALSMRASVICLSTVVSQDSPELQAAVALAAKQGVPIVTPAFADTGNPAPVSVLQRMSGVITVAGVDPDGQDVVKPPAGAVIDVYAPGKAIVGLGPRGGQLVGTGAGVATGFVAATLALVRQYRPELTPTQLKQRLMVTGYQQNTGTAARTIDPLAAVTAVAGTRAPVAVPVYVSAVPETPGPGGRTSALIVLAVSAGVIAAAASVSVVVPRAARRGWRAASGHRPAPLSPSASDTPRGERSAVPGRRGAGVA